MAMDFWFCITRTEPNYPVRITKMVNGDLVPITKMVNGDLVPHRRVEESRKHLRKRRRDLPKRMITRREIDQPWLSPGSPSPPWVYGLLLYRKTFGWCFLREMKYLSILMVGVALATSVVADEKAETERLKKEIKALKARPKIVRSGDANGLPP